ncbi:MAG: hypothetical protein UT14_C0020G0002 [Candidatus Shapirobacteria bacterium GW2011_GWE1_38_92]|uniref:Uncharacterized protein n=1 Tax=Candidatus Shapirobacteria bacterium GW2011_GWE1_38_92 TaxID=1618489 RepID=A0A0G0LT74_9BACT|nr:MAG: hypothetical protein UT14_C0020G0002 [Candidatus Shapirobacteria bacterium GW2011_GWE1_38_92]
MRNLFVVGVFNAVIELISEGLEGGILGEVAGFTFEKGIDKSIVLRISGFSDGSLEDGVDDRFGNEAHQKGNSSD